MVGLANRAGAIAGDLRTHLGVGAQPGKGSGQVRGRAIGGDVVLANSSQGAEVRISAPRVDPELSTPLQVSRGQSR